MKLTNRIVIKLYSPDNKKLIRKLIIKAPPKNSFTPIGVKNQLDHLMKRLDEKVPDHHYKIFARSKEEFRFYWDDAHKITGPELEDFYNAYNQLDTTPKNGELEENK